MQSTVLLGGSQCDAGTGCCCPAVGVSVAKLLSCCHAALQSLSELNYHIKFYWFSQVEKSLIEGITIMASYLCTGPGEERNFRK